MIVAVTLIILILMLAVGIPVAYTLAVSGTIGLYMIGGMPFVTGILASNTLASVSSYEFISVPMFILMAHFLTISGIANNLYHAAAAWMGRVKGGLGIATALTGAAFGAISGSSTAAAATLSATSIPAMVEQGYERKLASGVVAISGTIAMLIPPSIAMIFYGLLSGASVAKLLIAGIIPGIIITLVVALTVVFLVWRDPSLAPGIRTFTRGEKLASLKVLGPFAIIFGAVTGSIYSGIATPVEASAIGAATALVYAIALRRMTLEKFYRAVVSTLRTTAMIALILVGAHVFGYFLTITQTTQGIIVAIGNSGLPDWLILTFIVVIYLLLGCILELIAILILTVPLVLPIIVAMGYDPVWFGVVVILTAEVGMVTPPIGLNVFVVSKYTGIPVGDVYWGVTPHVIAHLFIIALICLFPAIATWLPSLM